MDKFWTLSWREFVLWKILFVSAQSSPKRSSACLEMLLSCRIIPHNVFTDTASNSLFSPSSNFPRLNSIGSTDLFISGMVDYQINQHREIKTKIPLVFDLHRMVTRSCKNDQIQKYYRFTNSTLAQTPNMATSSYPRFFAGGLLGCRVVGLSGNLRKASILAKKADKFPTKIFGVLWTFGVNLSENRKIAKLIRSESKFDFTRRKSLKK